MRDPTPTGKTRFRSQRISSGLMSTREVLVLQVEMKIPEGPSDTNGMPTYLGHIKWVDAGVEHLSFKLNI